MEKFREVIVTMICCLVRLPENHGDVQGAADRVWKHMLDECTIIRECERQRALLPAPQIPDND